MWVEAAGGEHGTAADRSGGVRVRAGRAGPERAARRDRGGDRLGADRRGCSTASTRRRRGSRPGRRWRSSRRCCWASGTTCRTWRWPRRWTTGRASGGSAASPRARRPRSGRPSCASAASWCGAGSTRRLFGAVVRQIEAQGLVVRTGTLVDATVIEQAAKTDGEADWCVYAGPHRTPVKGYKAHVAADEAGGIVRRVRGDAGERARRQGLEPVLPARPGRVWADSAYDSQASHAAGPGAAAGRRGSPGGWTSAWPRPRRRRGTRLEPDGRLGALPGGEDLRHRQAQLRPRPSALRRAGAGVAAGAPDVPRLQSDARRAPAPGEDCLNRRRIGPARPTPPPSAPAAALPVPPIHRPRSPDTTLPLRKPLPRTGLTLYAPYTTRRPLLCTKEQALKAAARAKPASRGVCRGVGLRRRRTGSHPGR